MSDRVKAAEVRDALMKKLAAVMAENKALKMASQEDYVHQAAKVAEGFWHMHNKAKAGDPQAIMLLTRWQAVQQEIFDTDYTKFLPKAPEERKEFEQKLEVVRETGSIPGEDKVLAMRKEAGIGSVRATEENTPA